MWNYCLGPSSQIPGDRLLVYIIDKNRDYKIVRRLEQVKGSNLTKPEGYVRFFSGPNCHPLKNAYPLVDYEESGEISAIMHHNFSPDLNQDRYLEIVKAWVERYGKPEYAL